MTCPVSVLITSRTFVQVVGILEGEWVGDEVASGTGASDGCADIAVGETDDDPLVGTMVGTALGLDVEGD